MRHKRLALSLIIGLHLTLSGCMTTTSPSDTPPIVINKARDSVVILGRRHQTHLETERDFVSCVGEQLGAINPLLNVIPEAAFLNTMFPYFEVSTAPLSVSGFKQLLGHQVFAQKVQDLNLKYIVWVEGMTETDNQTGAISCAVGPAGGGCFGFSRWDEEANYQADIWDIEQLALTAQLNTTSTGTSYVPAVIIPIPFLAQVQESACDSMADHLRREIRG